MTLGLGIWTLSQKWYYLYLVQDTLYKVMIVMLAVTGTMTAGLGCLGLLARSKTLLTLVRLKTLKTLLRSLLVPLQYTVLILLGFMMEAFIGLLSYIYQVHDVSTKRIFNLALLGWWMKDPFSCQVVLI